MHSFLTRVLYNRRSKMDPLWNSVVVAGFRDGKPFLGRVSHIGCAYEDNLIATGMGGYMALPILRERWHEDLTEEEGRAILVDAMRVLFYRDCRSINRIQIGKVDASGVTVDEPVRMDTKWDLRAFVQPKAGEDTGGSW